MAKEVGKRKYFCQVDIPSDTVREEARYEIYAKDWKEAKKIAEEKYIKYLKSAMSSSVIREDGILK